MTTQENRRREREIYLDGYRAAIRKHFYPNEDGGCFPHGHWTVYSTTPEGGRIESVCIRCGQRVTFHGETPAEKLGRLLERLESAAGEERTVAVLTARRVLAGVSRIHPGEPEAESAGGEVQLTFTGQSEPRNRMTVSCRADGSASVQVNLLAETRRADYENARILPDAFMTEAVEALEQAPVPGESQHFYLELDFPVTRDALLETLAGAGLDLRSLRRTTPNVDGLIMTRRLIEDVWNQETGRERCGGCPPGEPAHAAWESLSPQQRQMVAEGVTSLMNQARADELDLALMLGERAEFREVALSEHE